MDPDMETPSIVVEPPREEVDLIDGGHLNSTLPVYFGTYQCTTSSSRNASAGALSFFFQQSRAVN
ncbi:hypothetical protein PM082_022566 [Marasmius tenuissimus]|nr:hypothetical protein PM082_022566 [Marasmius tenuissimus]